MKDNINIAVLASYRIYPAISGGQRCTALLYNYISETVPVTLLSVKNNSEPKGRVILKRILSDAKWRYINPFLFFTLKRFIKEQKITHLIIEHPYYGWLGRLLKRSAGISFVVHSHNIEGLRFKSAGKWWWQILAAYEKNTHRNADMSFFITQYDLDYAKQYFGLKDEVCKLITYGTEIKTAPAPEEAAVARNIITAAHNIPADAKILLFNGALDYAPNINALDLILNKINPILAEKTAFSYKIIICGKNLPAHYNELKEYRNQGIIFAGFVPDIKPYFTGADIFINPVNEGGGIKTKLVEALGFGLSAVSTRSGAIGIPESVTGKKLISVYDNDMTAFCDAVVSIDTNEHLPNVFFDHFYWGNIAGQAARALFQIRKSGTAYQH